MPESVLLKNSQFNNFPFFYQILFFFPFYFNLKNRNLLIKFFFFMEKKTLEKRRRFFIVFFRPFVRNSENKSIPFDDRSLGSAPKARPRHRRVKRLPYSGRLFFDFAREIHHRKLLSIKNSPEGRWRKRHSNIVLCCARPTSFWAKRIKINARRWNTSRKMWNRKEKEKENLW